MLSACGKSRRASILGNKRASSSAPEPGRITSCWFHAHLHNYFESCCQEIPGLNGNTPPTIKTSSCFEVIRPARPRRHDIIPSAGPNRPDLHASRNSLAIHGGGPAGDGDSANTIRNARVRHAAIRPKLVVPRARVKPEVEPLGPKAGQQNKQQPGPLPSHSKPRTGTPGIR